MKARITFNMLLVVFAMSASLFAQDPQGPEVIHQVYPEYTVEMQEAGIGGTVVLEATIASDGTVKDLKYVSGPEALAEIWMEAVRQWRYKPALIDGKPVESKTHFTFHFNPPPTPPEGGSVRREPPPGCPDWSPKFDEIEDTITLEIVRPQRGNWDFESPLAQGFTYEDQIASAERRLAALQAAYDRDEEIWNELGTGAKPAVTTEECLKIELGTTTAMGAVCDQFRQRSLIFMTEGMLEILRCRAEAVSSQPAPQPAPEALEPSDAPAPAEEQ